MKRELRDKERKLFIKATKLRSLSKTNVSYEKSREIQKEQDEAYKMWEFYKGINNAMAERKQK